MAYTGTPLVQQHTLYLPGTSPIAVGCPAWFTWLTTAVCFSYKPEASIYRLTVRKEKRRNTFYWYAYLKVDSKLHNVYLGPSCALTRHRLEEAATQLQRKVHLAFSRKTEVD
jgi:hypothetical protein